MLSTILTVLRAIVTVGGLIPSLATAITDLVREWKAFLLGKRLDSGSAAAAATKDTSELENALDTHP